jgi:hypothetical protein
MKETRSASIELHPAGCVVVRVRPGVSQTVDDAKENIAASVEVSGGRRLHPLLVNIVDSAPLDSDVRHYYVGGAMADNFTALGLVVHGSPLGNMMGNVFFRMIDRKKSAEFPTRLFADEASAIAWLTAVPRK